MHTLSKSLMVLGLAALVASSASAQQPRPGGGFGGGGLTGLLQNKALQEEIKLDEEQIKKAGDALKKVGEDLKDVIAKSNDRDASREERAAARKKVTEAGLVALKDVLKPEQIDRIKQVQFQMSMQFGGIAGALADPELQKNLKLSESQIADIKTIGDDVRKEMEALQGGGFNRENFAKMQTIRKEAGEKVLKVMNDDQKKAWDALVGKPFEMQFGGGRPPRPNNNN
jgi:hypothetical protein